MKTEVALLRYMRIRPRGEIFPSIFTNNPIHTPRCPSLTLLHFGPLPPQLTPTPSAHNNKNANFSQFLLYRSEVKPNF